MSTPDNDAELTIALAEYAHINELRNRLEQKSSSRFSFFLALSTAVTAVAAGLLSQGPKDQFTVGAAAALGVILLVFGYSIFMRQVAFTTYSRRLTAASDAIRLYLACRAPGLRPHLFLPVGADRGAFPLRRTPVGGFAGAIGILNSAILALIAFIWLGLDALTGWAAGIAAALFLLSFAAHFAHIERSRRATAGYLADLERQRGIVQPAD